MRASRNIVGAHAHRSGGVRIEPLVAHWLAPVPHERISCIRFFQAVYIFGDTARAARYICGVEVSASIHCPFCGQRFDLVIDTSEASQQFSTDCEICCRPFEVAVECEPGEILSVDIRAD